MASPTVGPVGPVGLGVIGGVEEGDDPVAITLKLGWEPDVSRSPPPWRSRCTCQIVLSCDARCISPYRIDIAVHDGEGSASIIEVRRWTGAASRDRLLQDVQDYSTRLENDAQIDESPNTMVVR